MTIARKKVFFIASREYAVNAFLFSHLNVLSKNFDITVIVDTKNSLFLKKRGLNIRVLPVKISRKINLLTDLLCLFKFFYIFFKESPDIVHSITPKAGFLSMLSAYFSNIPCRLHTFTGQVWANDKGLKRLFLKSFDRLIVRLSTFNFIDSHSQRDFLIKERVVCLKNSFVFGSGSISGVDLKKFKASKKVFIEVRNELLIPEDAFVFIFLGRLNKDKGVLDLAKAFSLIGCKRSYLIFVGPDEGEYTNKIKKICGNKQDRLRFIGYCEQPYRYLAASNILCLPSYREGFGSVIIEAAAMGLPAIASNIYGIRDAVLHQKTGLLHQPKDLKEIQQCMEFYLSNSNVVIKNGLAAKKRVINEFDSRLLSRYLLDYYLKH